MGAILAASAPSAPASDARIVSDRQVSRAPSLPASCLNPGHGPASSDVEPHIAVNPRNANNIIATWFIGQEDFRERAKAGGLAYSLDGGRTWSAGVVQGVDRCTGGRPDSRDGARDTWLSFDPSGRAYLIALAGGGSNRAFWSSTSGDGGRNWSRPVEIVRSGALDKPSITADPTRPGTVYAPGVWQTGGLAGDIATEGDAFLSRSTDYGRSWSPRSSLYGAPGGVATASEIVVTPGGALVNVFDDVHATGPIPGPGLPSTVSAVRSEDGGSSWSPRTAIASHEGAWYFLQSDGTQPVLFPSLPSADVAPDGALYVAWGDASDAGAFTGTLAARVYVARSSDGGKTWSEPLQVGDSRLAFTPALAVSNDGTLGVTYYDLAADRRGDEAWTARVVFAHSHDGGRSWEARALGQPFDLRTAPQYPAGGRPEIGASFLGDYFGLAGTRTGFAAAYAAAKPQAREGRSDVFVASIALRPDDAGNSGCLARRSPIGPRNIGRVRIGYTRRRLLRLPVKPFRRRARTYRYCVKRSRGRVSAVFSSRSRRGRIRLVTTTSRWHGNRSVRPGSRVASFRRAYPNRRRIGRGLYRASPRSARLFGLRRGRVRFIAVAERRLLRKPRSLRAYLRFAGI